MEKLKKCNRPIDLVIFAYLGHGVKTEDRRQQYLQLKGNHEDKLVSTDEIIYRLSGGTTYPLLLILDCCRIPWCQNNHEVALASSRQNFCIAYATQDGALANAKFFFSLACDVAFQGGKAIHPRRFLHQKWFKLAKGYAKELSDQFQIADLSTNLLNQEDIVLNVAGNTPLEGNPDIPSDDSSSGSDDDRPSRDSSDSGDPDEEKPSRKRKRGRKADTSASLSQTDSTLHTQLHLLLQDKDNNALVEVIGLSLLPFLVNLTNTLAEASPSIKETTTCVILKEKGELDARDRSLQPLNWVMGVLFDWGLTLEQVASISVDSIDSVSPEFRIILGDRLHVLRENRADDPTPTSQLDPFHSQTKMDDGDYVSDEERVNEDDTAAIEARGGAETSETFDGMMQKVGAMIAERTSLPNAGYRKDKSDFTEYLKALKAWKQIAGNEGKDTWPNTGSIIDGVAIILGIWLNTQRTYAKNLEEGDPRTSRGLTKERIAQLNSEIARLNSEVPGWRDPNQSTLSIKPTVYFGENPIGDEGGKVIANALETSVTIHELKLGGNKIGDGGAIAIAKALENKSIITYGIDFSNNNIGPEGAKALAKALENNSTITSITLGDNKIGDEGAKALAKALENNSTITRINLHGNKIGDEVAMNHQISQTRISIIMELPQLHRHADVYTHCLLRRYNGNQIIRRQRCTIDPEWSLYHALTFATASPLEDVVILKAAVANVDDVAPPQPLIPIVGLQQSKIIQALANHLKCNVTVKYLVVSDLMEWTVLSNSPQGHVHLFYSESLYDVILPEDGTSQPECGDGAKEIVEKCAHLLENYFGRSEVIESLGASNLKRKFESIKQQASELRTLNVVVAGLTGAGKSTMINALLGHKVCRTGVGNSITSALMYFSYDDHDGYKGKVVLWTAFQLQKAIEDLINTSEIFENLKKAAKDRKAANKVIQTKCEQLAPLFKGCLGESKLNDWQQFRKEVKRWWKTYQSHQDSEREHAGNTNAKFHKITARFREIIKYLASHSFITVEQSDVKQFSDAMEDYTGSRNAETTTSWVLWPLIDKIVVTARFDTIRGLTLIDVPGYGDLSMARSTKIDTVMNSADHILLVLNPKRPPTSLDREFLYKFANSTLRQTVLSLCITHIQDKNDAESICNSVGVTDGDVDVAAQRYAMNAASSVQSVMHATGGNDDSDDSSDDTGDDSHDGSDDNDDSSDDVDEVLTQGFNNFRLGDSTSTSGDNLAVNNARKTLVASFPLDALSFLNDDLDESHRELTGIPSLQRQLQNLVAKRTKQTSRLMIAWNGLVTRLREWTQGHHGTPTNAILSNTVDDWNDYVRSQFQSWYQRVATIPPFPSFQGEYEKYWDRHAQIHHATMMTHMVRQGFWDTDMNQDIRNIICQVARGHFDRLEEAIGELSGNNLFTAELVQKLDALQRSDVDVETIHMALDSASSTTSDMFRHWNAGLPQTVRLTLGPYYSKASMESGMGMRDRMVLCMRSSEPALLGSLRNDWIRLLQMIRQYVDGALVPRLLATLPATPQGGNSNLFALLEDVLQSSNVPLETDDAELNALDLNGDQFPIAFTCAIGHEPLSHPIRPCVNLRSLYNRLNLLMWFGDSSSVSDPQTRETIDRDTVAALSIDQTMLESIDRWLVHTPNGRAWRSSPFMTEYSISRDAVGFPVPTVY